MGLATGMSSGASLRSPYSTDEFVFTLTSDTDNTFTLPLSSGGDYDFYIRWGDDTTDHINVYNQSEVTHTYPSASTSYTARITGLLRGWAFNNAGDKTLITQVSNWGCFESNTAGAFRGCTNLTVTATDAPIFINADSIANLFRDCSSLTSIDVTNWDTSNCTNFFAVFLGCSSLTTVTGCNNLDASNVTNFGYMFSDSVLLSTADVSSWDVSSGTAFNYMFEDCAALDPDVDSWSVSSSATNMDSMFRDTGLVSISVGSWNVSNVTSMNSMFRGTSSLTTITGLGSWDTGSLSTANNMFYTTNVNPSGCEDWDVTALTSASLFATSNSGITTTVYSDMLVNWEAQAVNNNVTLEVDATYNAGAATARANLIADHTWTINDGGAA